MHEGECRLSCIAAAKVGVAVPQYKPFYTIPCKPVLLSYAQGILQTSFSFYQDKFKSIVNELPVIEPSP